MDFKVGDRVKHPGQPAWGIGQILEGLSANRAPVYFVNGMKRVISFKHVALERVEGTEAEHLLLDNLLVSDKPDFQYITFDEALEKFTNRFPAGFDDPRFLEEERAPKLSIHEKFKETLSQEAFHQMIEDEKYSDVIDAILKIVKETDLIYPNEKATLRKGLKIEGMHELFARHLYGLLYGDDEEKARFDLFSKTLGQMKAAKWTIATVFPFILDPNERMLLKPPVTKPAADHSAFNVEYNSGLN
ncbi:MAG: DUF3553 domain-containing protein, partial [Deltaproteobacteria bacterium]|nr:DUF3553 domain-containing protein [Deltaproteobacteria bacterium]